jgi:hypothetical protein
MILALYEVLTWQDEGEPKMSVGRVGVSAAALTGHFFRCKPDTLLEEITNIYW